MIKPIKTVKIYEMVVERICNLIKEEQLKPGEKLPPERELAASLSVSRASVRQAVSGLIAKGILVAKQGDGTYVADNYSSKERILDDLGKNLQEVQLSLMEISAARAFIECEAARLCAIRADESICTRLKMIIDEYDKLEGDTVRLDTLNNGFHMTIAEGSSNRVYMMLVNQILQLKDANLWKVDSVRFPAESKYSYVTHVDQHRKIADAIIQHNPEQSEKAMREHLSNIKEEMDLLEA